VRVPIPVCRIIARLNIGGPALHVVNLTKGLDRSGAFRTTLMAGRITGDEGDMSYYARERGVAVLELPALSRVVSPLQDLRTFWLLFRHFRRERPLIVHTHTAKAGTLGRLAAFLAGVPVRIHTYHGHVLGGSYFPPTLTRVYLQIERQLARVSQRLVVLSEGQKRELASRLRVAQPDRFAVIPLGLELEPFVAVDREVARRASRAELGIPDDERVVGIVGRLVPVKNHRLLFRSVPILENRLGRPVRILVVGSGLLESELRSLAGQMGIGDRVMWLGWRNDLPDLYPAMDCLALTSLDEGTPVAVLEALAAGTPVAAREVGGVREILDGVPLGRIIRDDMPDSVASALRETLEISLPREQREGVRRAIGERYSVRGLVDATEIVYRQELRRAGLL